MVGLRVHLPIPSLPKPSMLFLFLYMFYLFFLYIVFSTVLHPIFVVFVNYTLVGFPILFLISVSPLIYYATKDSGSVLVVSFIILLLIFLAAIPYVGIVNEMMANSFHVSKEVSIPDFKTRSLPFEIARHYMVSGIKQQSSLGDIDPLMINGSFYWTGPLNPVGMGAFYSPTVGVVYQNAEETNADVRDEDIHFPLTEVGLTNNVYWHITMRNPFLNPTQIVYVKYGGKWYQVVSVETYDFRIVYSQPVWAGVFIFDEDGNEEFLTPEEAVKDPRLQGVPIYPESLARMLGETWWWKTGMINSLFYHNSQEELDEYKAGADVEENRQPYLVNANGTLYWVLFMKPYGSSRVLSSILLVDAKTGEVHYIDVRDKGWAGPSWAAEQVRRHRPQYVFVKKEYSTNEGTKVRGMVVREPMPVIERGTLVWKVIITPSDAAGVTEVIHIDAKTGEEVRGVTTVEEVKTVKVTGIPEIIGQFTVEGNTRLVVKLGDKIYLVKAEKMSEEELMVLYAEKKVTLEISGDEVVSIVIPNEGG